MNPKAEIEFLLGLSVFPILINIVLGFFLVILRHFSGQYRPWVDDLIKIIKTLFNLHFFLVALPSLAICYLIWFSIDSDGSFKAKLAYETKLPITFLENVAANSFVLNLIAYLWLGGGLLLSMVWVSIKLIKMSQRRLT